MTICHMKDVAYSDDPTSALKTDLASISFLFWFLWSTTLQFLFSLTVLIHDVFPHCGHLLLTNKLYEPNFYYLSCKLNYV